MNTTSLKLSCEFFPPRTAQGMRKFRQVRDELKVLNPEFFSVTFGAGGSTREKTFETVIDIQQSGIAAAPHLSCVASTRHSVMQMLKEYHKKGIRRIVALRGDTPSGWVGRLGEFSYANELVKFIRTEMSDFHIEVAAYPEVHPQAVSATKDLHYFKQKVDAGANSAITQYFYNADAFFHFRDNCHKNGIDIPIIPGIMPIMNYEQLIRFSDICGAEVPRWLRQQLKEVSENQEALESLGIEVVTRLCERLLAGGAEGLHFYTLNKSEIILKIVKGLHLIK
jgi:methylenetetrahydrofolate reductase (NADPH)